MFKIRIAKFQRFFVVLFVLFALIFIFAEGLETFLSKREKEYIMVEHSPPPKNDEQHPLLKVESGGGDNGRPSAPNLTTTGWNVACAPKRSWLDRCPELFSACWMSGMALGIFIVIIYGLGTMGVIRRSPLFLMNCNDTSPASEVHYHYLVEEGAELPFKKLSEYLTYMSLQYPNLHLNVIFLLNNNRYRISGFPFCLKLKQTGGTIGDLQMFRDYHLKYHNINMTIMSLPKFMAMTPWRYKWKKIPVSNLNFYLRVYSVWKNGGIGMDLDLFTNQFNTRQLEDPAITAILRQHNNGIKLEEYSYTLNKFDRDEQNEFASLFYGIFHQILNETRTFLNRTLAYSESHEEKSPPQQFVRTQRNKRDVKVSIKNASEYSAEVTTAANKQYVNTTDVTILDTAYRNTDRALAINHNNLLLSLLGKRQPWDNKTDMSPNEVNEFNGNKSELKGIAGPEVPQVVLLYDFSIFSENLGPSYLPPKPMISNSVSPSHTGPHYYEQEQEVTKDKPRRSLSYLLSIVLDGSFMAAPSKQHPFLGHLISTACQRMPPGFAIQDAILTQCPTMFSDSLYCKNIFIL